MKYKKYQYLKICKIITSVQVAAGFGILKYARREQSFRIFFYRDKNNQLNAIRALDFLIFMLWIRIHLVQKWILDPDPSCTKMDPDQYDTKMDPSNTKMDPDQYYTKMYPDQ